MTMKWFRLYSELLHDRKLIKISRITHYSLCETIGAWVSILCIANESPERGFLMLTDTITMTSEDIATEIGMTTSNFNALLEAFVTFDMIRDDGECYYIAQWDKRQFKSDDGYERVKRFREKQTKNDETFQKRFRNENETPPDTDTDTDTDSILMPSCDGAYAELLQVWQENFPNKPQPRANNKTLQSKLKTRMKSNHFKENWKEALVRAGRSQFLHDGSFFDLSWFLKNDDHYDRCLNGKYDDRKNGQHQKATGIPEQAPGYHVSGAI